MSRRRWLAWALAALALGLGGCGSKDKLDLRTPGVTPHGIGATATPTPPGEPVTRAEVAVIRGWSESLRHGHVAAAARYFALPVVVANGTPPIGLTLRRQVVLFNRGLPCGARLLRWRRAPNHFVIATFRLTRRPGGKCGSGTGNPAAVAFRIRRHRITEWLRVPETAASGDSGSAS